MRVTRLYCGHGQHYPGQATSSWRRLFYGALAHGMKTLDLYEFHSSWHATENYVYTRARAFRSLRVPSC